MTSSLHTKHDSSKIVCQLLKYFLPFLFGLGLLCSSESEKGFCQKIKGQINNNLNDKEITLAVVGSLAYLAFLASSHYLLESNTAWYPPLHWLCKGIIINIFSYPICSMLSVLLLMRVFSLWMSIFPYRESYFLKEVKPNPMQDQSPPPPP